MSNKTTLGILCIGLGIIWFLNNFGYINAPSFWNWIAILLIAGGTWRLVASQFTSIISSLTLIGLGIVSGLLQLNIIRWADINRAILPVLIIVLGLRLVLRKNTTPSSEK